VDASTEVEVPGAVRLDFDIAMGKGKASESLVTEARFGRPGIVDYGHADRIAAVRDGLAKVAPPVYDSPASNLILRTFAADGVTYLWLVNIYDREEWDYINSRLRPGAKVTDKKQALAEVKEFLKARSAYDKPFTTTVTLPAGDVTVCDVWSGRELAVQPVGDGRVQCGVSMERLGGTLLALYPARAQKVTVATWPDPANPKRGRVCEVRIFDARGRLLRGAVPLRIDVRFPDGTPAPYGGPAVGHNGRYIFTITAADNEPAGTWTVAVRELAFGTQAELTTAVE
jgi:hypothetical protein